MKDIAVCAHFGHETYTGVHILEMYACVSLHVHEFVSVHVHAIVGVYMHALVGVNVHALVSVHVHALVSVHVHALVGVQVVEMPDLSGRVGILFALLFHRLRVLSSPLPGAGLGPLAPLPSSGPALHT